ncbi:MAG TPA: endonuclease V [Phycisphaerales bacterium]|nr:endonuclease V [Phycisphaerales bacterium]
MNIKRLHPWNLTYAEARALQIRLSGRVRFVPVRRRPRRVAGLDCALSRGGRHVLAVVVVLEMGSWKIVETADARCPTVFPYIPGLLSFRETPACLAAVEKLKTTPDLFLIDGQGIAHPRRFGLAAHLGLFLDKPTIGCAKSRLVGRFDPPAPEKGAFSPLTDTPVSAAAAGRGTSLPRKATEETIGAVVRTRTGVKPLFVSIGHRCTLDDAIGLVLACTTRYRLPEPTRLAHQFVSRLRL